ncbi:tRNA pseudouridine(13) synthase TruD [Xanthomonadaceae bacterium XH05]|nr:tRNA pseudouridine(13) synthase TruD [Xanthomonadaceae bacterium XH05]
MLPTSETPRALGPSVMRAAIRSRPDDFIVEEMLGFEPSGQGEHLFLTIEKRGANTHWVAQQLARWAGIPEHAVGYAGLKDRHAVTRQAFTLHLPGREAPPLESLAIPGVDVLAVHRHQRKLPRGALRGNRFTLTLREVAGDADAIEQRLCQVASRGVPNAFGEQRFGRDAGNVPAARAMFAGRRASREKRSIYLSAARSVLFNRILDERIKQDTWDRPIPGDVFMLDGSHSVFGPEPVDDVLAGRIANFDVHPTGALWGMGEPRTSEAARAIEDGVASADAELAEGLVHAGLKQERRALRVAVSDLAWHRENDTLTLSFHLPAGSYATAVLDALGEMRDASSLAA